MRFADYSEKVSLPGSPGFVQFLTQSIQLAQRTEGVTALPSLLIHRKDLPSQQETECLLGSKRIEDQVLAWFRKNHFEGDRVKKNEYGYPGLFRKLFEPPPWVEDITIDEFLGEPSEERERELRPLYLHCLERGEKLLEIYREYLVRQRERSPLLSQFFEREGLGLQAWKDRRGDLDKSERLLLQQALDASDKGLLPVDLDQLDGLKRKIGLACLLGSEAIEGLYEAILHFDEYSVVEGAPDLLLWHPNAAYNLWCFAEVKGPGDHLRESQSGWIRSYWEHIRGHIVILHID